MNIDAFTLTVVFAMAVLIQTALHAWLSSRQARHVMQHRQTVPPAFAEKISLAAHQKAADYTLAKLRFGMWSTAIGTVILIGWTLLGGLNSLNQWILSWFSAAEHPLSYQLVLMGLFVLIGGLIELPLSLWSTFKLEQAFGFNRTTLQLFFLDMLKSTLIGAVIGLPIAALILWVMNSTGAYWWIVAWGLWMGINVLMMVIYPTVIAPLFNKFQPLEDNALKTRVEALLDRCGFKARGLFVMDGSRRSAHGNAYFTGFGASKRIVFFDTLINKLTPSEIEAVLAHELGHFKRKHIIKRMISMFALSLLGFALLGWLTQQAGFYIGLGVRPNMQAPNDALALLLFMMALPVFTAILSPLMASWSRQHEFEADAYACEQTKASDLISALLKLYEDNASTLTPDHLYARFYYSHPPATERIAAMQLLSSSPTPASATSST